MSNNRYRKDQFNTVFESQDVKIFETVGVATLGDVDESVANGMELLPGNVSIDADVVLGSAYDTYAKYAKQHGRNAISMKDFLNQATADAMWRIERMREIGGNLPEFQLKLNTPAGSAAPITLGKGDEVRRYITDGLVSTVKGAQIRMNLADCPSILMVETAHGETVAISAWHFGYKPIDHGMSKAFLDYCASNRNDKIAYLTPGIHRIEIFPPTALTFSPPDEEFWNFAHRRSLMGITTNVVAQLAAYVRNLAERAGVQILNAAEVEDTFGSARCYSHRAANYTGATLNQGADPFAKLNGRNGYSIAWL